MRGHTPTMLLTTSTRDGIDSSPVMMARRRLVRGHHPIAMFGTLQSRDNEFRHGEGIHRPKDGRRHLLQTALEETQVENRVFHQLVRVPTSQLLLVSVRQHMRPARNRNKGTPNYPPQLQQTRGPLPCV